MLKDGRKLSRRVAQAKGQPRNPLTEEELEAKFRDAAARALPPDRVAAVLSAVRSLEELPDVRGLARLMSAGAR